MKTRHVRRAFVRSPARAIAAASSVAVGGLVLFGIVFCGLLVFIGCSQVVASLEPEEHVVVSAPALPPQWYADYSADYSAGHGVQLVHRVSVSDELGRIEQRYFSDLVLDTTLKVPKERITAVSYEISPRPGLWLKSAGGVYPLHRESDGTLTVSYENGFLAGLLHTLLRRNPGVVRNLNIGRLELEILQRSRGNPWHLDQEAILRRLSTGSMRADSIRLIPGSLVNLELLNETWISLNPLDPRLEPPAGGSSSPGEPEELREPAPFPVMLHPGEPQRWYQPERELLLSAVLDPLGNVEYVVRDLSPE